MESLGLKLRYHLEQERSEHGTEVDETAVDRLARAIDDVADSVEHAIKDEAVKADVKDILAALPGALADTFNHVAAEVRTALEKRDGSPDHLEQGDPGGPSRADE